MPSNNTFTSNQLVGRSNTLDPFVTTYPDFPNTNAVLQVGRESEWNPASLGTTTKTYTCPTLEDCTSLALWCPSKFFSYRTKELANQVYQITITIPYDEITNADNTAPETVNWEILPNTINRSIFESGIFPVIGLALDTTHRYTVPPEVQAAILKAVANNDTLALANDKKYAPLAGIAQQFYAKIKSGQTSVRASLHTLKRTATFNINNKNAYDNYPLIEFINEGNTINPVLSTQDLITLFQVDEEKRSHLIPSYKKFKTSTAQGDPFTLVYLGGYLVGRPQTIYLTPTKVQITQFFEFDEWADDTYIAYSNPSGGGFPTVAPTPYPAFYTGKAA